MATCTVPRVWALVGEATTVYAAIASVTPKPMSPIPAKNSHDSGTHAGGTASGDTGGPPEGGDMRPVPGAAGDLRCSSAGEVTTTHIASENRVRQ